MQRGDFDMGSVSYTQYPQNPYYQNSDPIPNPNSGDRHPNPLPPTYASAPPFSTNYSPSDYTSYSSQSSPYPQNPDPVSTVPPSAPSYSENSNLQSFNPYTTTNQQQPYFPSYDHQHSAPSHYPSQPSLISPIPTPNSNPIAPCTSPSVSSFGHLGASVPSAYENSYNNGLEFNKGGSYMDEFSSRYGVYGRTRPDPGSDVDSFRDDSIDDGVYAYNGGKSELYGARGTASKSSTWSSFDDYGRPISFSSGKAQAGSSGPTNVVRAVPKGDTQQDVKSGVLKFRVKLLPEGGGQGAMDVLCQIGLDGIRMVDPTGGRTLRIYPLDSVTKCDVTDSSTLTIWAKSSVDIEPRRIRLQSNSYTTTTLLDTVTAATIQLKEMGGRTGPAESLRASEQTTEKKKGFGDWVNMLKPANEEKDHWVPDEAITKCTGCGTDFGAFVRRHHCRNCGDIFCNKCTNGRIALTADENALPVRVCDRCMAEATQRLSNAKETTIKPAGLQSHEDLAKKLQEEMERNRKASSGSKSDVSGERMREVACPTCTVHLQVQVPSSGSETIECGVCQHPFLVGAY